MVIVRFSKMAAAAILVFIFLVLTVGTLKMAEVRCHAMSIMVAETHRKSH